MPVTKKKETYSEAMARLEKIVSQIDNNELEIDVLVRNAVTNTLRYERT